MGSDGDPSDLGRTRDPIDVGASYTCESSRVSSGGSGIVQYCDRVCGGGPASASGDHHHNGSSFTTKCAPGDHEWLPEEEREDVGHPRCAGWWAKALRVDVQSVWPHEASGRYVLVQVLCVLLARSGTIISTMSWVMEHGRVTTTHLQLYRGLVCPTRAEFVEGRKAWRMAWGSLGLP